ncbi:uncharacterized protein BDZ99DRAFT_458461 [Mytilinidion resinicola]|uniref:Uncharacterized protein n=1 Tax=Mytilinidion resinicola TaxID=574789 RepID=A0A6A6Z8K1_9PEZI|nr:uncharacterized protein BDZ99DRAFT_458461 [Mytilinidion resinicola]KAF2816615.1 hypothetical protein BDZ99DRAFT_458461 [Mytilinidion resinicola]
MVPVALALAATLAVSQASRALQYFSGSVADLPLTTSSGISTQVRLCLMDTKAQSNMHQIRLGYAEVPEKWTA